MRPLTFRNRLLIAGLAFCLIALTTPIVFAQEGSPTTQATPSPNPAPSPSPEPQPADPKEVAAVASAVSLPTLVGSGITAENIGTFPDADAFIIGSSIKEGGLWSNPIDADRVRKLAQAFQA